ncbi:NAD(P)/FAD-dependent oxidoreductase [Pseudovibrio sp. Ad26]|uniref:NAD(P)/FAD-dependent oxidoreductase n=1 Tax=Pseudovibrio sp. Ad26 TaxID=989410 RepID=UPI0007AED143|nr:NAD(P)/FAD-dependent oxidoreductase [Pseudovibrio sp. Ad26]KZL15199.1 2,4-dichlorophenol 6-monooxygenase [Pseudovibrio sp. Ad26]
MTVYETDVLVIGGGPAGSTAAAALARNGIKTTILERDVFPRYHIGESLLASLVPMIDIIGATEKVAACGFVKKPGGYFNWGGEKWAFRFDEVEGAPEHSFQVERAEFDNLLIEHAGECGAEVHQNVSVNKINFEDGRAVRASWTDHTKKKSGELKFKHLIDCSGRNGVLANGHFKNRRFHDVFKNVALWAYYDDVDLSYDDLPAGSTRILAVDQGWIWFIPLKDNKVSVGLVIAHDALRSKRKDNMSDEEIYNQVLEDHPEAKLMLQKATRGKMRVESDYSYTSDSFSGPGFFMSGDAACFLDPLLSSGVHLAMFSALMAAACITSIHTGDVDEDRAHTFFETSYRQAYLRFLMLVSTFYDMGQGQKGYFAQSQKLTSKEYDTEEMKTAFVDIVSGTADFTDVSDEEYGAVIVAKVTEKLKTGVDMRRGTREIGEEEREEHLQFMDGIVGLSFLDKNASIGGLYVEQEPTLKLAEASA